MTVRKFRHYRWPWRVLHAVIILAIMIVGIAGFLFPNLLLPGFALLAVAVVVEHRNDGYLLGKDKLEPEPEPEPEPE